MSVYGLLESGEEVEFIKEEMENHAEIVTNSMELKLKFNGNPPKGKKYFKDQNFHLELDVKRLH